MERRETPRRILIESPTRLEAGQNFYNYPPFGDAIGRAVSTSTRVNILRRAITKIARDLDNRDEMLQGKQSLPEVGPTNTVALGQVLGELQQFPEWEVYVEGQLDSAAYGEDGKTSKHHRQSVPLEPPLSYAAWVEKKIQLDRKINALTTQKVVRQVFPNRVHSEARYQVSAKDSKQSQTWEIFSTQRN